MVSKVYQLCLELSTFDKVITIPDLELKVEKNCLGALTKAQNKVDPVYKLFNHKSGQQKVLGFSDLFINSDDLNCPLTSFTLKHSGCNSEYTGDLLSLNDDNEIVTNVNNDNGKSD